MKIRAGVVFVAMMATATATTVFAQGSGADAYKTNCAMCHGADGQAGTPTGKAMKVPAFATSKLSEAEMIAETKNGKPPRMPAFASKLNDAQIKGVVAYIRTLAK